MSSGDASPPQPYPARRQARERAASAARFLHATLASVRCRELIEQGCNELAERQLSDLRATLAELDAAGIGDEEVDRLRIQERKLRALLAAKQL